MGLQISLLGGTHNHSPSSHDSKLVATNWHGTEFRSNEYICISRLWKAESPIELDDADNINNDGKTLVASPQSLKALKALRAELTKQTPLTWCDVYDIRQSDQTDKARLIPRMYDIYAEASRVAVLLPAEDVEVLQTFIKKIHAIFERGHAEDLDEGFLGVQSYFSLGKPSGLQYNRRVWTLQELLAARAVDFYDEGRPVLTSEEKLLLLHRLEDFVKIPRPVTFDADGIPLPPITKDACEMAIKNIKLISSARELGESLGWTVTRQLYEGDRRCTNHVDLIYGIYKLFGINVTVSPDRDVYDVWAEMNYRLIAENKIVALHRPEDNSRRIILDQRVRAEFPEPLTQEFLDEYVGPVRPPPPRHPKNRIWQWPLGSGTECYSAMFHTTVRSMRVAPDILQEGSLNNEYKIRDGIISSLSEDQKLVLKDVGYVTVTHYGYYKGGRMLVSGNGWSTWLRWEWNSSFDLEVLPVRFLDVIEQWTPLQSGHRIPYLVHMPGTDVYDFVVAQEGLEMEGRGDFYIG